MKNNTTFIVFCVVIILMSLSFDLAKHIVENKKVEGYTVGGEGVLSKCNVGDGDYDDVNVCHDISYMNADSTISSMKARIDPNYFIDSNHMVKKVPYGYQASFDKLSYSPKTQSGAYEQAMMLEKNKELNDEIYKLQSMNDAAYQMHRGNNLQMYTSKQDQINYLEKQKVKVIDDDKTSNKAYDSNNYDVTYHSEPDVNGDESTAGVGKMWIKDGNGALLSIPYTDIKNKTLYYETGSYPFGPSSYVPNYEESTLLSKYSNKQNTDSDVYGTTSQQSGFCEATKSSVYEREQKCNQINHDVCASTDCCVLLGGQKCVAGNVNGPSVKANYSDFLVVNRDYYYYKGKCYGNCFENNGENK